MAGALDHREIDDPAAALDDEAQHRTPFLAVIAGARRVALVAFEPFAQQLAVARADRARRRGGRTGDGGANAVCAGAVGAGGSRVTGGTGGA